MKEDDGPWVSLPSKNHPNEVYYFNVLTGVSTWEKPENFRETSDTLLSSASAEDKSEKTGYVVESLSPKSSPKKQSHQKRNTKLEGNEKKGDSQDRDNIPENKRTVKEFPSRFERNVPSKSFNGSYNSKLKDNMEKKYFSSSLEETQRQNYVGKINNKLHSKINTQTKPFYQTSRHSSLSTNDAKPQQNTSSSPVSYGSASLRLEKLKSKLADERLRRQNYQFSEQGQYGEVTGKETKYTFHDKHKTSISGSCHQQHPYVPSLALRSLSPSSSKCVDSKFKNMTYRNDKGLQSVSVNFCSRRESTSQMTDPTLVNARAIGCSQDYFHSSEPHSISNSNQRDFTFQSSIKPQKGWQDKFSSTYLKNSSSNESGSFDSGHNNLFSNSVLSASSKVLPYSAKSSKHFSANEQLQKKTYVPYNADQANFLKYKTSSPVLSKSTFDNSHFLPKSSGKSSLSSSDTVDSFSPFEAKTPATDRLKRLKTNFPNKFNEKNICLEDNNNNFYTNRSLEGKDFNSVQPFEIKSNVNKSSGTESQNVVDQNRNNNSWEWNTQYIVRDYNHQRVDKLSDLTSSSNTNFQSKLDCDDGMDLNSPICKKSLVNSQQSHENKTHEFIEPNQETLRRLYQNTPRKKMVESKGGISKLNRVQKQIRSVAPKFRRTPTVFPSRKSQESLVNSLSLKTEKVVPEHDDEEMMDWEPIEPEKVVIHVEELRKDGSLQGSSNPELSDLCNLNVPISSKWFIVLDTNVLLSHLEFVEYLRDIKDYEFGMPTLYIPWIVLQELDGLKSSHKNPSLKFYARKVVRFLQDNLESKHPRIRGQPKSSDKQRSQQPDDRILQCSLDLQRRSYKVLLVTNDRNLFNKAIVSGVDCCSAAKLHEDLENRRNSTSVSSSTSKDEVTSVEQGEKINIIVCQIKDCVKSVLEEVLKTEMILAYDRSWIIIVARKPPWTVNDVLFCILKHWIAVFGLVFPSSTRDLLEKILSMFQKSYMHSLSDAENLLNACVSLVNLLATVSYKQVADKALRTLQELKECLEKLNCANIELSTVTAPSDKFHSSKISGKDSCSDSDSRSSISRFSSKSRNTSNSSNEDSACERGSHINTDVNESDDDCLSLVASSFCDNLLTKQLSESTVKEGQEIVHYHLNKIWEKVAVFCGTLCDLMGIEPCVPYEPPDPFPSKEILHQNMLFFVKCVSGLLRSVERILSYPSAELFENHPAVLNFCSFIRDCFPNMSAEESRLLPHHVYIYCSRSDTRQQLDVGKKQFEQFENVLSDAVSFFMKHNMPGPSVMQLL